MWRNICDSLLKDSVVNAMLGRSILAKFELQCPSNATIVSVSLHLHLLQWIIVTQQR